MSNQQPVVETDGVVTLQGNGEDNNPLLRHRTPKVALEGMGAEHGDAIHYRVFPGYFVGQLVKGGAAQVSVRLPKAAGPAKKSAGKKSAGKGRKKQPVPAVAQDAVASAFGGGVAPPQVTIPNAAPAAPPVKPVAPIIAAPTPVPAQPATAGKKGGGKKSASVRYDVPPVPGAPSVQIPGRR